MEPPDLVSNLRSELAASAEAPVPGGLFAAAQRRARRRTRQRRALVATLGLVFLGGAVLGTLRWNDGGSPDDVATGPSGTTDGTADPPGAENGFSAEGAGILLSVRPNGPGFAVVDLDDGTVSDYPPGSHTLPEDAVSGVTVTPRGDAVVWQYDGVVRVVPDADFSQPPLEITPTRVRSDDVYAPSFRVASSPDGSQLWIVQRPLPGETSSLIDLVDASTGENIAATEVDLDIWPVAATGDSLIVNTGTPDSDDQDVVRLEIDGATDEVATDARGVAVYGDIVATIDPSGANLSLVDMNDGSELAVEAPSPGLWTTVGEDIIPGESGPLPVVSPEGELLVQIGSGNLDTGDYVSTLYGVSMVDGTSRPLADFEGPSLTPLAWSADGEHVVTAENLGVPDDNLARIAMLDPEATEREAMMVVAELESGYFPLAAG